ncbi:MAG: hypothetical protein P8J87_14660, partial [Verrucomicrobiales bacterium]|nr:hypothetical protein [Verrucomicrobiales bacterium]
MSTKRKRGDDVSPDTEDQPIQYNVKVVLPGVCGTSDPLDVLSYSYRGDDAPQTLEELMTQTLGACPDRLKKHCTHELVNRHFFVYIIVETTTETDYRVTHKQLTEAA